MPTFSAPAYVDASLGYNAVAFGGYDLGSASTVYTTGFDIGASYTAPTLDLGVPTSLFGYSSVTAPIATAVDFGTTLVPTVDFSQNLVVPTVDFGQSLVMPTVDFSSQNLALPTIDVGQTLVPSVDFSQNLVSTLDFTAPSPCAGVL